MYTQCAGERVSSAMCLFVFEWASVVSPFCELVASGMSSQRFNGIYRLFAHNVHNRLCEMAVGGRHTRERGNSIIVHRACASQKIPQREHEFVVVVNHLDAQLLGLDTHYHRIRLSLMRVPHCPGNPVFLVSVHQGQLGCRDHWSGVRLGGASSLFHPMVQL